jgi:protein TonB
MPLPALDPAWAGPRPDRTAAPATERDDAEPPPLFSTRRDPLAHLPLTPAPISDATRPADRATPAVVKSPKGAAPVEVAPGPAQPAVVEEAETVDAPPPAYPRPAVRKQQEGRVVLLADVRADGTVEKVRVESTSGFPLLDDAAIDALERWRFKSRVANGKATPFVARVPFQFSITR